jgi:hypothetical protein
MLPRRFYMEQQENAVIGTDLAEDTTTPVSGSTIHEK